MRRLLLLVGAIVFVDTMFFAALTPLLPHYSDELGLSKAHAGLLAGAYPAGCFVGAIPGGLAAARLGVKPAALIGLSVLIADDDRLRPRAQRVAARRRPLRAGHLELVHVDGGPLLARRAAPAERRGELIGSAFAAAIGGALFGPVLGGIASLVGTGRGLRRRGRARRRDRGVRGADAGARDRGERQPLSDAVPGLPRPPRARRRLVRRAARAAVRDARACSGRCGCPSSASAPSRSAPRSGSSPALEAIVSPVAGRDLRPARARRRRSAPRCSPPRRPAPCSRGPTGKLVLAVVIVAAALSFGIFWTPAMSMLADAAEARRPRLRRSPSRS